MMVGSEISDFIDKYEDVVRVEGSLKRKDPSFKVFYFDIPYPRTLKVMVEKNDELMAQMPKELVGEEDRVNLSSPNDDRESESQSKEDMASSSTLVRKGPKRQKTAHVPERAISRALDIIPSRRKKFIDMRQGLL